MRDAGNCDKGSETHTKTVHKLQMRNFEEGMKRETSKKRGKECREERKQE